MKKNHLTIFSLFCMILCCSLPAFAQKQFVLKAPDGKLEATINVGKTIDYTITHSGDLMLDKSAISMTLNNGLSYGVDAKLSGSSTKTVNQTIDAVVYKRKKIKENYNELTLKFKGDYNIVFRVYNDGIAYRFVSTSKKTFIVGSEQAEFNFPADRKAFINYANKPETRSLEDQLSNSFEQPYHYNLLSEWNKKRLDISPFVVEGAEGKKICIVETDLINYPGMFLYPGDKANSMKDVFLGIQLVFWQKMRNSQTAIWYIN